MVEIKFNHREKTLKVYKDNILICELNGDNAIIMADILLTNKNK